MATSNTDSFIPSTKEYQVLQKYFGTLTFAILNPVELAADLYASELISESTRVYASTKTFSCEIKTHYLLNELLLAVAIDPTNFNKIISVLQQHPPLLSAIAEKMKTDYESTTAQFISEQYVPQQKLKSLVSKNEENIDTYKKKIAELENTLKVVTDMAVVQLKISTAKTQELETLKKELSTCKEKLLKSTTDSALHTRMSTVQLEFPMLEKEIQTESMELSVLKKDISVQFNYLTDILHGVHVGNKTSFLIQGDCPQFFNWDECGLRISIPRGTLSSKETNQISVTALVGGQFTFPEGTELISAVYSILITKPLLKPVKLEIKYQANIVTKDHTNCLSFVNASPMQPAPPYKFQVLKGGEFRPGNQYGSITMSHYCCFGIIISRFYPNRGSLLSYNNTSYEETDFRSTVITHQPRSESQKVTMLFPDVHTGALTTQTFTNEAQLISLKEDIQISSLFSSASAKSTFIEETHRPGLEPCPQSSFTTPNVQPPPAASLDLEQDESPNRSLSPDNMYVGQVVYEVEDHNINSKWLMRFIVAKQPDALQKYVETKLSKDVVKDSIISFMFDNPDGYIELVFGKEPICPGNGWTIYPHVYPTQIYKSEVDRFGALTPPLFPSRLFTVFFEKGPDTVKKINYSIPLQGVEPKDMKICIFCSLSSTGIASSNYEAYVITTSSQSSQVAGDLNKITPKLLCHLLANINDKWNEIGIALGVEENVLSGLRQSQNTNTVKLSEVINSWITTKSKTTVTWETVISAIGGPVVNNKQKAMEIREYLIAHYTKDY